MRVDTGRIVRRAILSTKDFRFAICVARPKALVLCQPDVLVKSILSLKISRFWFLTTLTPSRDYTRETAQPRVAWNFL